MTRSAFGIALFCLVIGALTGSWATFAYTKSPATRSAEEWIAHAKEVELTPCFPDATASGFSIRYSRISARCRTKKRRRSTRPAGS